MDIERKKIKVKDLQNKTGLPILQAKNILIGNDWDVEEAIRYIELMKIRSSFPIKLITYRGESLIVLREFNMRFDEFRKNVNTDYIASLKMHEIYPVLTKEYIRLKNI